MTEKRWYPSQISLPDGRALVVGGVLHTSGTATNCSSLDLKLTRRYEVFDVSTWQFTSYQLRVENCNGSNFDPHDQRPYLGNVYPRLHLISYMEGQNVRSRVAYVGPREPIFLLNPDDLTPGNQNNPLLWQQFDLQGRVRRQASASVLLPNPTLNPLSVTQQVVNQVLVLGGFPHEGCIAYQSTEILNLSSGTPVIRTPSSPDLIYRRGHVNAVILPTGKIFVVGGLAIENKDLDDEQTQECNWCYPDIVLEPEMYTPPTLPTDPGSWQEMHKVDDVDRDQPTQNNPCPLGYGTPDGARVYHTAPLLLPDARVLGVGTSMDAPPRTQTCTLCPNENTNPKVKNPYPAIYSPPYLFKSDGTPQDRPVLNSVSPQEVTYGQTFQITFTLPTNRSVQSVVLIRPGSVTHSVNFEQRLVRCYFSVACTDDGVCANSAVTAPWSASIAPPGWYMLFLVDSAGVPSVAKWVKLSCPPGAVPSLPSLGVWTAITLMRRLHRLNGIRSRSNFVTRARERCRRSIPCPCKSRTPRAGLPSSFSPTCLPVPTRSTCVLIAPG